MSDLIERQSAIDAVESAKTAQTPDGEIYVAKLNAEMNIQILPSAEPERKTGRWISDRLCTTNGGTYGVRRCSVCESYYHDFMFDWNFCPNCGADMRGEEK